MKNEIKVNDCVRLKDGKIDRSIVKPAFSPVTNFFDDIVNKCRVYEVERKD